MAYTRKETHSVSVWPLPWVPLSIPGRLLATLNLSIKELNVEQYQDEKLGRLSDDQSASLIRPQSSPS